MKCPAKRSDFLLQKWFYQCNAAPLLYNVIASAGSYPNDVKLGGEGIQRHATMCDVFDTPHLLAGARTKSGTYL
jgi:hypothetical protein